MFSKVDFINQTYFLSLPNYHWLLPLLCLTGILMQLISFYLRNILLLLFGMSIIIISSCLQKDFVLLFSDIVIGACLYICIKK